MNTTRIVTLLACATGLAACATAPDGDYPSLGIREAEYELGQVPRPTGDCVEGQATGQFEPPAPVAPPPPPPVLSADLVQRVAQLEAQARAAHADFESAISATRSAVSARGSVGSKSWGRAETAYANLRALRARTAIPLADLDTLVATRWVAGEPVDDIIAVRDTVAALVEQEDEVLGELAPR